MKDAAEKMRQMQNIAAMPPLVFEVAVISAMRYSLFPRCKIFDRDNRMAEREA